MTKRQPSATNLPPSRLCRLLIISFAFKFVVLGLLIFEPGAANLTGLPFAFSESGPAVASAATQEGAGAPPSIEATLPDAGMGSTPPAPPQSIAAPPSTMPSATPGVSAPAAQEQDLPLPAIRSTPQARQQAGVNATAPAPGAARDEADALARRQEDLARKEQELRVLESELADRLERMQLLENRLAEMIKEADQTVDSKFRHLVDVLSNMKAKQAAAVIETLDQKIAVKVLSGMRGRQAGEILTFVKPEIAATLTEALAGMQLPLR